MLAGNKSAQAAFDERARKSSLQLQADKAKVHARHLVDTRALDPAKLERRWRKAIAVNDEAIPVSSSSSIRKALRPSLRLTACSCSTRHTQNCGFWSPSPTSRCVAAVVCLEASGPLAHLALPSSPC